MTVIALHRAPEPTLSEARRLLRDHCAAFAQINERVAEHNTDHRAAELAEAELRDATKALDEVDAIERAQWRSLVADGGAFGDRSPQPLTALRSERTASFHCASARAEIARQKAATSHAAALQALERHAWFVEERDRLVAAVLLEEATAVAEQYMRIERASKIAAAKLSALKATAFRLKAGLVGESIDRLMRLGTRAHLSEPVVSRQEFDLVRSQVSALADGLCADATLTLNGKEQP